MDKSSERPRLAQRRTRKILVVDRCEESLALTTDLLERAGFWALWQTSAQGAPQFAVREGVDAAVIELDSLARGERVARALRGHVSLATLPVVLMSGERNERVDRRGLPGVTTLARPLASLALVPLLRSLIDHRVQSDAWERRC